MMMGAETAWWKNLIACPSCGFYINPKDDAFKPACKNCTAEWALRENIIEWKGGRKDSRERLIPLEWIVEGRSKGAKKFLFLIKRLLWNVMKTSSYPVRFLFKHRIASFHKRSLTDKSLAQNWKKHYFKGLTLPSQPIIYEYSYRKVEKIGFAGLLGHKIVVQDIREHSWWGNFPHVLFQIVPAEYQRVPIVTDQVDVVFTDGVIFDMDTHQLKTFLKECYRIIRPGGYLIIWGGNSLSRSRAKSEVQWHGRIHSPDIVREVAQKAAFVEKDFSFEGFSPPVFPQPVNMIRKAFAPWPFKSYDYDSWLSTRQKPENRAYWLLRLAKPVS